MPRYTEEEPVPQANIMPKLIIIGIIALIVIVVSFFAINVETVEGNQLGVKETWSDGVVNEVLQPKTYFLFPGWSQKIYTYDASVQMFVMNDKAAGHEKAQGREKDSYLVQSAEGQDMTMSMNVRWRIDPKKLVEIHKTVRQHPEEKLIRPVLMRVAKDAATKRKAIEAYSGEGLVQLQAEIQRELIKPGNELTERGIIVENFVIEEIKLDPKYIDEIKQKQIATQRQLKAVEEQKAAEAEALVAKSKAQADLNKMVVEAERDKQVGILKSQMLYTNQVLQAEGKKQELILEAEGQKEASIAKAQGVLAMGKAEAEAKELLLKAWAVPGAESFVKVEVAKSVAEGFKNVQGYLPGDLKISTLSGSFVEAIESITGRKPGVVPVTGTPPAAPATK